MQTQEISIYQVDAFTDQLFSGNPAAVCPLDQWLPDAQMQAIAAENNLAETAFFVPGADGYDLRWFTPTLEIDLCGHATLAAAHVIFHELAAAKKQITFYTHSGPLAVWQTESGLMGMNFPSRPVQEVALPVVLENNFPTYRFVGKSRDYLVELENEAAVAAFVPDLPAISQLDAIGLIVTAPGEGPEVDFVSRFFAPQSGVPEDPVTGSAHCNLIPFWASKLKKTNLRARQISARGGDLWCEAQGDRVVMMGKAVTYLSGTIVIPIQA